MTTRKILRADGREELIDGPKSHAELRQILSAVGKMDRHFALTQPPWHLGRQHVMVFDDCRVPGTPSSWLNERATALRREQYRPGTPNLDIYGDAAILPDADFASQV